MDLLSFFEDHELLRIFQQNKTEMSLMENPMTFLKMLKDHRLIPEEKCTELKKITIKEKKEEAVYDLLDCIEKEKPREIRTFWECVSKESILNRYPILQNLYSKLAEELKVKENNVRRGNQPHSDPEPMQTNVVAQNKEAAKMITSSTRDDELPSPSSQQSPEKKKKDKKSNISLIIKGKQKLPVTCGDKEGKLTRRNLATREKCIEVRKQWFTPPEFQEYGGMGSSKNWKKSIKCHGTTLEKLIKDGDLKLQ